MNELTTLGSGSYLAKDVALLLQPINIAPTPTEEKERLIQSGERHYSEMIGVENPPSEKHQQAFSQAFKQNDHRMARDIESLKLGLLDAMQENKEIVIVSLVRAGLPIGVLLKRALENCEKDIYHYGISIIRDKGIDKVALEHILARHNADDLVFVDGWTGKGAISGELDRSLVSDNRFTQPNRLVVLADPCGKAWLSASSDDWIIPSGILGSTISGLVSRSILGVDGELHGSVFYDHLADYDLTQSFIESINSTRQRATDVKAAKPWTSSEKVDLQDSAMEVVHRIADEFDIESLNRIKPGIAEATRAVLRRVPHKVFVRDLSDPDVQLLKHLATQAGVDVEEIGEKAGPYRAITIIQKVT